MAGLTKQAAQALVRLRAITGTQHIIKCALVTGMDIERHDSLLDAWWDALAATTLTTEQRAQVDLPFKMGDRGGGKLRHRCHAAFLAGALQAVPTLVSHFGAASPAVLHHHCPRLVQEIGEAADRLKADGVADDLRRWQRGQPQNTKGLQQRLTRQIQKRLHTQLLPLAPQEQQLAIRAGGGTGAASFLRPPSDAVHRLDDTTFTESLRSRLAAPDLVRKPDGSPMQCQHRSANGASSCGVELDAFRHHGRVCPTGGYVSRTHDDVRDTLARRWRADLGLYVLSEQRTPQYDYTDSKGKTVRARMDLIVNVDGTRWQCDVTIVDADSDDPARRRQRAARDGVAAASAEDAKRRRYGKGVVPLVWETGGRIGEAGLNFLRRLYAGEAAKLSALMQEIGCVVAAGTATASIAARTE